MVSIDLRVVEDSSRSIDPVNFEAFDLRVVTQANLHDSGVLRLCSQTPYPYDAYTLRLNFRLYNWEKARPAAPQDLRPRDPREICFNGTCRRVIAMA
jgi:hypothetical protein